MSTDAPVRSWASDPSGLTGRARETADDKRLYVEIGLAPVTCARCGTEVLVKKNSDKHTSVQWTTDAVASCPEFAAAARDGKRTAQLLGCSVLKQSIEAAVKDGSLVVPDA